MSKYNCVGWWEQDGLGRQPMLNLVLNFDGDRVRGSGLDIIAPFTMEGRVQVVGVVEILKQYQQRHSVLYVGQYDGEGSLYGNWQVGAYQGKWFVKLQQLVSGSDGSIQDIGPER